MDPSSEDLEQARIGELLEARCQELRLTWNVVAQRSGLSREGLSRLRRGVGTPRRLTKRGVEDTLFWRHGSIDRIIRGGNPEPYGTIARTGDYVTVTFTERDVTRTVRADTGRDVDTATEVATAEASTHDATVTTIEGRVSARLEEISQSVGLNEHPPFPNPTSKTQRAANQMWEAFRLLVEDDPSDATVRGVIRRGAVDLEELQEREKLRGSG
jgi:transcriptional regulator with XRE-family HTH domain